LVSADAWIGLAAIVVTVFLTLGAALIVHIRHDERRETRLEAVEKEIGTREIGMRGAIHEHGNALSWLGGCVWFIAAKIGIDLPKRDK
jgi:hypothetical protein